MTTNLDDARAIRDCERVFRRNGLPLLISEHRPARDVFGRSAPFLIFILFAELFSAIQTQWPWWANVLTVLGAVLVISLAYSVTNLLRGRTWGTMPQGVDFPELTFFVLAPALIPLVLGGEWERAIALMLFNGALLLTVRVVVGFGVLASLGWGLTRIVGDLAMSITRLMRTLPLLLIVTLVLFYNGDVWQVFSHTASAANFTLGAIFALLLVLFVLARLRSETQLALGAAERALPDAAHVPDLTKPQRFNVATMIATTQFLQVAVVTAGVWLLFVAIGSLTITPQVMTGWQLDPEQWTRTVNIGPVALFFSTTLLRVVTAIAAFTGLYFTTSLATDPLYRTEFIEGITQQLQEVLRTRITYHALVTTRGAIPAETAKQPYDGNHDEPAD